MRRRTALGALLAVPVVPAVIVGEGPTRRPAVAADATATIDPSRNWGTWEGWGTSLAWWARRFGDSDNLADILFTLGSVSFDGRTLPGLGLTIARYNAGACSWNRINGEAMVESPKIMRSRQIEGYWTDWSSTDPASSSWNWTVDANQRAMLLKARQRGADRFELFSNSPMWWMCRNHNPSGADDGTENLQSWNIGQHAAYLATIARRARDDWGIAFESVEPFNEPIATWWNGRTGTQEGCHLDVGTQAAVINALRGELNKRNLSSTIIAASDESYYDQALSTWLGLGDDARGNVGRVNVHGYQKGDGRRDLLHDEVARRGKRLWNSEYGESDRTGKELVSNLVLDLRWLHPTAWVYWQVLDGGGWGLIDADVEAGRLNGVNQKYYALAQYTRHIRPGMRILDGGADNVVAAYDADRRRLVVAAVNWGDGRYLNVDLSRFAQPARDGAGVVRWRTQLAGGDQYARYQDTTMSGTRFWSWFDPNTVQTFEVDGVVA